VKRPARSLLDTNIIIRYLVADNPTLHAKAKEFFDKVIDGSVKAIILESVIAECVYVLTKIYKVPRDRAAGSLIDILHYKGVANDDRQALIQALALFSEQSLDIVDCILCVKAVVADDRLLSFDVDLNKLAKRISP
jgi:predicted nucleic-acid-binding protein